MYSDKEIKNFKRIILTNISNGRSLKNTLDSIDKLPSRQTVYNWLSEDHANFDKSFLDNYVIATNERAYLMFEEILSISDNIQEGTTTKTSDKNGTEVTTGDMISHRRLQVDARKWMLSKMMPKKYGDKLDLNMDVREVKPIITKRRD